MSILLFLVGLVFALGLGQVIVSGFLNWVRTTSQVPRIRPNAGVPNWIVGLFERSFAFALAFANVQGAYVVLGAYLAAKLTLNWKRIPYEKTKLEVERRVRVYGISALMAGVLSLSIGVIGGAIARCGM
jgi:hypothetical protein